jgi:hypothetical protein
VCACTYAPSLQLHAACRSSACSTRSFRTAQSHYRVPQSNGAVHLRLLYSPSTLRCCCCCCCRRHVRCAPTRTCRPRSSHRRRCRCHCRCRVQRLRHLLHPRLLHRRRPSCSVPFWRKKRQQAAGVRRKPGAARLTRALQDADAARGAAGHRQHGASCLSELGDALCGSCIMALMSDRSGGQRRSSQASQLDSPGMPPPPAPPIMLRSIGLLQSAVSTRLHEPVRQTYFMSCSRPPFCII